MRISYNWLTQYLSSCPSPEAVAEILTNCGLEVEAVENFESIRGGLKGLLIGEVTAREKHPNADRLSVTNVDVGDGRLRTIVCGAPNVAAGQKVVVALPGMTLHPVTGEPFELKAAKIRGVESEGMICAEDEIGLSVIHEGILVLDPAAQTGSPASEYFQIEEDVVFHIGITPNRGDALSHLGVARDVAAALTIEALIKGDHSIYGERSRTVCELKIPSVEKFAEMHSNASLHIDVTVEDAPACPRYSGISMSSVTVADSPSWLKNRLGAAGLKPINNVVDIANFVMMECGQPLHIFDADEIAGNKIIVKKLNEGAAFVTLDGVERTLSKDDLMICNEREGMCMAGVFGGKLSGVSGKTKKIFIESAFFDPGTIRKTSKRHCLHTDASSRFERRTDPEGTLYALKRAALLIKEIAGGNVSSGVVDRYPHPASPENVTLRYEYFARLGGVKIEKEIIRRALTCTGFTIAGENEEALKVAVPSFKTGIAHPADVAEEILRIYGYNHIPFSQAYSSVLTASKKPDRDKVRSRVSDLLSASGFSEMLNNSLTRSKYYELLSEETRHSLISVLSPANAELDVMRQSSLFSGLEVVAYNRHRQISDQKLYEFGKTYSLLSAPRVPEGVETLHATSLHYSENEFLSIFLTGNERPEGWRGKPIPADFYHLKDIVSIVLNRLGFTAWHTKEMEPGSELFSYGLLYHLGKPPAVRLGGVKKKILQKFDIASDVYYAEFDWAFLLSLIHEDKIKFTGIPKFPTVRRDLALVLDKAVRYSEIERIGKQAGGGILKEMILFDVYEGTQIAAGKKSLAVGFTFQDEKKTFTDEEINRVMEKIIASCKKQAGAEIR